MKRIKTTFILYLVFFIVHSGATWAADAALPWPKKIQAAVSLTYDDAVSVHYQTVAPLLEKHGLRGTFYLTVSMVDNATAWKKVAGKNHELGNHALFHPCRREPAENYTWLPAHYDLVHYSPERFRDELRTANMYIDLLDGGKPRTYGNNCTNLTIGSGVNEVPMDPILDELMVAARGNITNQVITADNLNLIRLGHFNGDGRTFEQIKAEIEQARKQGGWIIYMFHGVGKGTHPLFIEEEEHRKLVEWLAKEKDSLWTAPVVDVANYLESKK